MDYLELKFYEHASIPDGAPLLIRRGDDLRLPDELRGSINVPCVVARDLAGLEQTLTLLHVAELWEEATPCPPPRRNVRPRPSLGPLRRPARESGPGRKAGTTLRGIVIHFGGRVRRSVGVRRYGGLLSVVRVMPAGIAPSETHPRPVRFVFYDGDRQIASSSRVRLAMGRRYPGVEHWFVLPDERRWADAFEPLRAAAAPPPPPLESHAV